MLVGISRMYVGVHYPLDILGATFITLVTSGLVMQSTRMFEPIAKFVFKMYALVARRIPFLAKYNHIAYFSYKSSLWKSRGNFYSK